MIARNRAALKAGSAVQAGITGTMLRPGCESWGLQTGVMGAGPGVTPALARKHERRTLASGASLVNSNKGKATAFTPLLDKFHHFLTAYARTPHIIR